MYKTFVSALLMLLSMTVICGLIYPLAVTGVAQLAFPDQARGSLVSSGGEVVGSRLIGRSFEEPRYFWGRPSATSPRPYTSMASAGSNLGTDNPSLQDIVSWRLQRLRQADPSNRAPVPLDLVMTSGSGLDPDISPEAARYQIPRVARLRGLSVESVTAMVARATQGRQLGLLGEPRVNVLALNMALDGR